MKMELSLKFVETPYPSNHLGNLLARFRTKGYVVLPNVFERESVDNFRQEVEAAIVKNQDGRFELPDDRPELVYPLKAPRIRAPLSGALSPSQMLPKISVFETAWLISQSGKNLRETTQIGSWHKDRQHEGMPGREYHYPLAVHLGIYYRDIESIEDGPAAIIPRSHQDQKLNPYNDSAQELFLARKEDVVMWDQRLWHQANIRQKEGWRIFTIYGFYAVQAFKEMPRTLAKAWLESEGTADEVFYGGTFSLSSVRRGLK